MSHEDRQDLARRAEEIARLFIRIADERPAVLDALHALLTALCAPAGGRETDHGAASREPLRADDEIHAPAEPAPDGPPIANVEADFPAESAPEPQTVPDPSPAPSLTTAAKPPREPRDETKAEASMQMLRSLFPDGFGSGAARGGLSAPSPASSRDAPASLWEQDVAAAREIAGFARAQGRRLRSIRRARHDGRAIPQAGDLLARNMIDDWLADPTLAMRLEPRDLREAERWYRTAMSALLEVADWLESHPDTPLGEGYTPSALHHRLQCVATAQKGLCTWIDDHVASSLPLGRQCCGVQLRVYQQLAWVWTKNFRTKLDHMMRDQRVLNDARAAVERSLALFELESAPAEPKSASTPTSTPPTETQTRAGDAPRDGFDSVGEALDAAEDAFACAQLVFSDRARESAERSAFRRPGEAYAFFQALHAVARTLASGTHGDPHDLLQSHGFHSKPSHQLTMARHHRFYHMRFEGREVDLSQHVTLGSRNQNTCMSIHWWHDSSHNRFVIGHCGKHLPNTRS